MIYLSSNNVLGPSRRNIAYVLSKAFFVILMTILFFSASAYFNLAFPESKTIVLVGNEFNVTEGNFSHERAQPSVAYNSVDNEYIVVWSELTTDAHDIFGQRISVGGELLDSTISVIESEAAQNEPYIVHNSTDNEYLTVWTTQQPGFTSLNNLLGIRLSNNGTHIGNDFFITAGGLESAIAYNSTANEYFVTARKFVASGTNGIVGRRISNIGALIGSPTTFGGADLSSAAPNGHVAYNAIEDEFFASYRNQELGRLEGQRILSNGSLAGNPNVISTLFPGSSSRNLGRIAFDPTRNRYLVVFGLFMDAGIVGQFVSSDGQPVGSSFSLDSGSPGSIGPYAANVAYSGIDDCFLVVWNRNDSNIAGRLVSGGGELSSDTYIIAPETASSADEPGLAYNSQTSEFMVAWIDDRNSNEVDVFGQLVGIPSIVPVAIDIKPGNKRNVINPRAKGGVWVAVLSDTNTGSPFDPSSQVDIPTVELGPDGAKAIRHKVKDVNKDGLADLLLRFKIPETGIACGDTEATLTGDTFNGQSFSGTDSIKTVGCKKPKKAKKEKHKGK